MTKSDLKKLKKKMRKTNEEILEKIKAQDPNVDLEEMKQYMEDIDHDTVQSLKNDFVESRFDFFGIVFFLLCLFFVLSCSYYIYFSTYSPAYKNVGTYNYVVSNIFKEKIYDEKYNTQFDPKNKILKLNNVSFYDERKLNDYYGNNVKLYDYHSTCEMKICNVEIRKK